MVAAGGSGRSGSPYLGDIPVHEPGPGGGPPANKVQQPALGNPLDKNFRPLAAADGQI